MLLRRITPLLTAFVLALGALLSVTPAAQAAGTLYNDGSYGFYISNDGVKRWLGAGSNTAGIGWRDVDTVTLGSSMCGKASVNYGAWKLVPRTWTVPDGQVHYVAFIC